MKGNVTRRRLRIVEWVDHNLVVDADADTARVAAVVLDRGFHVEIRHWIEPKAGDVPARRVSV